MFVLLLQFLYSKLKAVKLKTRVLIISLFLQRSERSCKVFELKIWPTRKTASIIFIIIITTRVTTMFMYHYIMSFFLSLFLCHHVFHQHPKHLPLSKLIVLLNLWTLLTILSFSGRWIFALRSQTALSYSVHHTSVLPAKDERWDRPKQPTGVQVKPGHFASTHCCFVYSVCSMIYLWIVHSWACEALW